jgi:O-acetyl-ADP-ribose deacetylase (regulator of RNase III)
MNKNIIIKTTDITKERVCAIVNAANSSLLGGGGVDGAIHWAGGEDVFNACWELRQDSYKNGLPIGEAIETTAGKMPSQYIIHTVGPIYKNQTPQESALLLASCYQNSLKIAKKLGCKSIAFPAISTGVFAYPKADAAKIAYAEAKRFLEEVEEISIYFTFFSHHDEEIFKEAIKEKKC